MGAGTIRTSRQKPFSQAKDAADPEAAYELDAVLEQLNSLKPLETWGRTSPLMAW